MMNWGAGGGTENGNETTEKNKSSFSDQVNSTIPSIKSRKPTVISVMNTFVTNVQGLIVESGSKINKNFQSILKKMNKIFGSNTLSGEMNLINRWLDRRGDDLLEIMPKKSKETILSHLLMDLLIFYEQTYPPIKKTETKK
ncbi:hypothetical protein M0813_07513 [Anaeramoeba flamelloides]|uniref:Uncharacterized protein n=1 Tax=Anaeramoeba flamelloides TaxID=1746091 RepID=A0ABQ8XC67_9EUKA|nr:hypothetical protein M0813_07513 [Anaeramoeba flamelloides]